MSFIKGKQNIYSIISNSIVKNIQTTQNNYIRSIASSQLGVFPDSGQNYKGMPTNLIVISSINANCGESQECSNCMKIFGITDNNLQGDNYLENKDKIDKIRNNQCLGSCTCNIQHINTSNTFVFSVGYSIDGNDATTNSITENIIKEMQTYDSSTASTTSRNWLPALLGIADLGLGLGGLGYVLSGNSDTITNKIKDQMSRVVNSISMVFNQTINQLLTSVQTLEIQGTGIQIKNVSISTVQNAVLSAIENSTCTENTCINNDLSDITNTLINTLLTGISTDFLNVWKYAYEQNKTLIYATIIFLVVIIAIYIILIFKKASQKKGI